jgi:hypothetical protein
MWLLVYPKRSLVRNDLPQSVASEPSLINN